MNFTNRQTEIMKVIKTKIIEIGREKRVALYFGYNKEIIEKIKQE